MIRTIRSIAMTLCLAGVAHAADDAIVGVQTAALDQPRIYLHIHRTAGGPALEPAAATKPTKKNDPLSELLDGGAVGNDVEAFVDTGASGIVISQDTATQLSIKRKPKVTFSDIGVGGSEKFGVSEPLYFSIADYPTGDGQGGHFSRALGPFTTQLRAGGGILESLAPGMDILGTPALGGHVIVLDPSGLSNYDKIHTNITDPGDGKIPQTALHVPLTEVSFAAYSRTEPVGEKGPAVAANPMIGPSPFVANDSHPGVKIRLANKTVTGTFLLDTGAATSMISLAKARELGLKIDADGKPTGVKSSDVFSLAVGGLGGMKQSSGTFFDELDIPTRESRPIRFKHAPLLISDISMTDASGKTFTLDGVFGMNYLVASAEITGGLVPDIGNIVDGPWKLIVIDLKRNELGLEPK